MIANIIEPFSFEEYENDFDSEEEYADTSNEIGNFFLINNLVRHDYDESYEIDRLDFLKHERPFLTNVLYSGNEVDSMLKFEIRKIDIFSKEAIKARTLSYELIAKEIWDVDLFS